MAKDGRQPSIARLLVAFAVAPAALPVLVFLVLIPVYNHPYDWVGALRALFWVTGFFGYAPTLVLGVPAYLLLRRRMSLTPGPAIMIGALIATAPAFLSPSAAFVAPIAAMAGGLSGLLFWAISAPVESRA